MAEASKRSVLSVLTKGRLEDLAREFGITLQSTATKDAQVAVLADSALDLPSVLGRLRRDELRSACRAHGVDPGRLGKLLGADQREAEEKNSQEDGGARPTAPSRSS